MSVTDPNAPSRLFDAAVCAEKDTAPQRSAFLYDLFSRRFISDLRAPDAVFSLVRLLASGGEYDRATGILATVMRLKGDNPVFRARVLYYRALVDQNAHRSDSAGASLAAIHAMTGIRFPEAEQAYLDYIGILAGKKDHAASLAVFRKLDDVYRQKSMRMPWRVMLSWADNARLARSFAPASELYALLLRAYPDSAPEGRVRFHMAECETGLDNFTGAMETLQLLSAADSAGEWGAAAALKMGDLHFDRKQFAGALAAYEQYMRKPASANRDAVQLRIGRILQENMGEPARALSAYDILLSEYPGSVSVQTALFESARCLEVLMDYPGAVNRYRRLLYGAAANTLAVQAQARIDYITRHRIADAGAAVERLNILISQKSGDSFGGTARLLEIAEISLDQLHDPQLALRVYDKIGTTDPFRPQALSGMARAYVELALQARSESDATKTSESEKKAREFCVSLLTGQAGSQQREQAAYCLIMLSTSAQTECEAYLRDFPQGSHRADVRLQLARLHEEKGDPALLRSGYDSYSRLAIDTGAADQTLAGKIRCAMALGWPDTVIDAAAKFGQRYPLSGFLPEVMLLRARALERKGRQPAALATYRELISRFPGHEAARRARLAVADNLYAAQSHIDAVEAYRGYLQACGENGDLRKARLGLGRALSRAGNIRDAQDILLTLADASRDSVAMLATFELGTLALRDGDTTGALESWKAAAALDPAGGNADAFIRIGDLQQETRAGKDAYASYVRALERARSAADSASALKGCAVALILDGRRDEGMKLSARFRERYPGRTQDLAAISYAEAMRWVIEREYAKARTRFDEIAARYGAGPWGEKAAYQSALCLRGSGRGDERRDLLAGFLKQHPGGDMAPYALCDLAAIYNEKGDYLRSAERYAAAAAVKSADRKMRFRAAYNSALAYQRISAWGDAALMYQTIGQEFPNEVSPSSLNLKIGFCLVQASRYDEALPWFRRASRDPAPEEKPELLYWTGKCHAGLGQVEKAITEYLKVPYFYIGIGKWAVTAQFEAARLYEKTGDPRNALLLYREIVTGEGRASDLGKGALQKADSLAGLLR